MSNFILQVIHLYEKYVWICPISSANEIFVCLFFVLLQILIYNIQSMPKNVSTF